MRVLLVAQDNGGRTHWAPIGLFSLANALVAARHEVTIWHQDVTHEPDAAIVDQIDRAGADSVGLGWIAGKVSHARGMNLARLARPRVRHLVLGGHGPSSAPQWHLDETRADAVVVGEAEGVARWWAGLTGVTMGQPGEHRPLPMGIGADSEAAGIAYYPLAQAPGADAADRCWPVMSGFGCPYQCSFCFRMPGQGFRVRDADEIVAEVEFLKRFMHVGFVQFQDELLMSSPGRVRAICEAVGPLGVRWSCQGRVNVAARDTSILRLMHEAGCRFINYGIESTSQHVLDLMGKRQTVEQSTIAVEATLAAGISPGLNMLWGCPGDDEASLWSNVVFLERYDDHCQRRTIRPVTPYPGSGLYNEAVATGLIRDVGHFYELLKNSDLITVDYMEMSRERAHALLYNANLHLLRLHQKAADNATAEQAKGLYCGGGAEFRGWRQT